MHAVSSTTCSTITEVHKRVNVGHVCSVNNFECDDYFFVCPSCAGYCYCKEEKEIEVLRKMEMEKEFLPVRLRFFFFFLSLLYDFLAFGERSVCIRIESARLRKWTRRGGCLPIQHSCACMRFHVTIIVITGYECDIQDKNCCNIHKMADETAEMNGRLRLFANLSVMRSFHYEYEQRRGTMRPMKVTGS